MITALKNKLIKCCTMRDQQTILFSSGYTEHQKEIKRKRDCCPSSATNKMKKRVRSLKGFVA